MRKNFSKDLFMEKRILSYGYQGTSPDDLAQYVDALNAVVFDCRISPYSFDRNWSKKNLDDTLGSRYVWIRALGNLNYKEPGSGIKLRDAATGVRLILKALERKEVILICMCRSITNCHLKRIVDILEVDHKIPHTRLT